MIVMILLPNMFSRRRKHKNVEFDEVLVDISNVSDLNRARLEGQLERPISKQSIFAIGVVFCLVIAWFSYEAFTLQVIEGSAHRSASESNSLNRNVLIAERGVIFDRTGEKLVWNEFDPDDEFDFAVRAYTEHIGLGQILGYVSYPQKDRNNIFWRTEYIGRNGVEGIFNERLSGENGQQIIEVDATGGVVGEHVISRPQPGDPVYLTIDAQLTQAMYDIIATSSEQAGFRSGAGAIMDVETGEIIALTSYPSYDPAVMAAGRPAEIIEQWNKDERFPFLNKAVGGVYTPGSVVKPFVSYAALVEGVVNADTRIESTGSITIPNPYNPDNPSRFTDWRAHGVMDLREAIAFSSNVYMYHISGGYRDRAGLGIERMNRYFRLFGWGEITGVNLQHEQTGVIPDPEWKQSVFNDVWRLGDTYLTSIGQFGFQATPLQVLRAYAALANGGFLLTPQIEYGSMDIGVDLQLNQDALHDVQRGMRMAVNYDGGTARPLERRDVAIAAKSGTAEVGVDNRYVNSWVAGYWPYEDPKYAFVIMMDRAPRENQLGATRIMGDVVEWMSEHTPHYLGLPFTDEDG